MQELSFILAPTPDLNYNVELHYFYYPESITTAASGTTWLSDNFSPVLLYGALRETSIFQKGEPDMVGYYESKYQEALAQYRVLCEGFEESDSYRAGTRRVPVK